MNNLQVKMLWLQFRFETLTPAINDAEDKMLSHEEICNAVTKVANAFSLTKASYFGSYAEGRAAEKSDLDLLVEFARPSVSVWTIAGLKYSLEDELRVPVDVIHAPLPEGAIIEIGETVVAYEQS
jgi:predicted nucleotidyltransferase